MWCRYWNQKILRSTLATLAICSEDKEIATPRAGAAQRSRLVLAPCAALQSPVLAADSGLQSPTETGRRTQQGGIGWIPRPPARPTEPDPPVSIGATLGPPVSAGSLC